MQEQLETSKYYPWNEHAQWRKLDSDHQDLPRGKNITISEVH